MKPFKEIFTLELGRKITLIILSIFILLIAIIVWRGITVQSAPDPIYAGSNSIAPENATRQYCMEYQKEYPGIIFAVKNSSAVCFDSLSNKSFPANLIS